MKLDRTPVWTSFVAVSGLYVQYLSTRMFATALGPTKASIAPFIWIYLATDLCQPVTRCNRLARLTQPRDAKENPIFGRVPKAPEPASRRPGSLPENSRTRRSSSRIWTNVRSPVTASPLVAQ